MAQIWEAKTMDSLLKDLFGIGANEPEAPPAATQTAAAATTAPETTDEQREARREARRQRKADPDRKRKRDDFVERYTTGHPAEGFSAEEALEHLAEIKDELSPTEFQAAMVQTLDHLPADQRDEFIALVRKHREEAAKAAPAAAAATATAAEATAGPASAPADPFGGLLTGLFGGASSAGGAGGVDAGSLLDDLRKGGLSAPSSGSGGKPTEADFLSLINSPLGKAVLGGLAAYGMQQAQADTDDHDTPGGAQSRG
jgi:hypothetical protein